jgi:DNA-directed RNA polymerase sigma subunit (sigma70/sigma32)
MSGVLTETPTEVQDLRVRYVAALDSLREASDRLFVALREANAACDVARDLVASGRPIGNFEDVADPLPLRTALSDALADFERRRHAAQRYLFLLLQSEGKTLADIGRAYGISRQLVSRLVNEPEPPPTR